MYRIETRMFGPRVCSPNRCQLHRRLLKTPLPAFMTRALVVAVSMLEIIMSKSPTLSRHLALLCFDFSRTISDQQLVVNCFAAFTVVLHIQVLEAQNVKVLPKEVVELCNRAHLA